MDLHINWDPEQTTLPCFAQWAPRRTHGRVTNSRGATTGWGRRRSVLLTSRITKSKMRILSPTNCYDMYLWMLWQHILEYTLRLNNRSPIGDNNSSRGQIWSRWILYDITTILGWSKFCEVCCRGIWCCIGRGRLSSGYPSWPVFRRTISSWQNLTMFLFISPPCGTLRYLKMGLRRYVYYLN